MASAPCTSIPGDPPRTASGPWRWILLFAGTFAIRAVLVWVLIGPHRGPRSDPAEYDAVAWNLARGLGFSLPGPSGVAYTSAVSPPLLPWIVSLLYRVTGHHYFGALLLQCALGALALGLCPALRGVGAGLVAL